MGGVYKRNKLFEIQYQTATENLPALEEDVSAGGVVAADVLESYETSLEDGWPDFIKNFYAQ